MIWADSPEKVFRKAFTRDIRPVSQQVATKMKRSTQKIRYANASDGVKLAWAESGSGPVLIKAANWMTHLEYE